MQVIASNVARQFVGEGFGGDLAIVDAHARFQAMQARDLQQVRREVDRGDVRAGRGHRFAEQPAAAADVEHARAGQRRALGDVAQPRGIQRMQRLLRAVRDPTSDARVR